MIWNNNVCMLLFSKMKEYVYIDGVESMVWHVTRIDSCTGKCQNFIQGKYMRSKWILYGASSKSINFDQHLFKLYIKGIQVYIDSLANDATLQKEIKNWSLFFITFYDKKNMLILLGWGCRLFVIINNLVN